LPQLEEGRRGWWRTEIKWPSGRRGWIVDGPLLRPLNRLEVDELLRAQRGNDWTRRNHKSTRLPCGKLGFPPVLQIGIHTKLARYKSTPKVIVAHFMLWGGNMADAGRGPADGGTHITMLVA
jgi:hypothetical protein